jgi:acyl carrier protein phosphodiesterase
MLILFLESTKSSFRYHHYAGVIVDVFYDHFGKKLESYSNENLEEFIERFYQSLGITTILSPEQQIYGCYVRENWLLSYQTVDYLSGWTH